MASIEGKTILITGANRGIGRGLVEEALQRGAARVYAGTRTTWAHPDSRVVNVLIDVTNLEMIAKAARTVAAGGSLDVLINNAGIALYDDLTDRQALERQLEVNLFGPYEVGRAFLPLLTEARGAIVNNTSVNAVAPLPVIPAYSASKAAAFNMTQSLKILLAGSGVRVQAILTGPVDTDMNRDFPIPKATVESAARVIVDGIEKEEDYIFPDPLSQSVAGDWSNGPAVALERAYAALAEAAAASASYRRVPSARCAVLVVGAAGRRAQLPYPRSQRDAAPPR
jgi:NAD(P)-dependent dehydrogenase (short-subunit alcohol dehydrogenase family)